MLKFIQIPHHMFFVLYLYIILYVCDIVNVVIIFYLYGDWANPLIIISARVLRLERCTLCRYNN